MSLFEALEMDRDKTLTELAKVERDYTGNDSPGPAEHLTNTLDMSPGSSSPYFDRLDSCSDLGDCGLIIAARNEISSIRSSLSRKSRTNDEALQDRIARHSRRISSILEDDQKGLSQRWLQTPRDNCAYGTTSSELSGLPSSQELIRG